MGLQRIAEEAARCIKGARLVRIPHATHWLQGDHAQAFNDAVSHFSRDLAGDRQNIKAYETSCQSRSHFWFAVSLSESKNREPDYLPAEARFVCMEKAQIHIVNGDSDGGTLVIAVGCDPDCGHRR